MPLDEFPRTKSMEFTTSSGLRGGPRPRNRLARAVLAAPDQQKYLKDLTFYSEPPGDTIPLVDLENWALQRLEPLIYILETVLRLVERVGLTSLHSLSEWRNTLINEIRQNKLIPSFYVLLSSHSGTAEEDLYEARRKDYISHFILRAAYSTSEDRRRWFIQQECDFFRARFMQLTPQQIDSFLQEQGLHYVKLNDAEKNVMIQYILGDDKNAEKKKMLDLYKVPWLDALELVRGRRVFLQAGMAYITTQEFTSIVTQKFREFLEREVQHMSLSMGRILEDDERMQKLLQNFEKYYLGPDYSSRGDTSDRITLDMIGTVSKESYPLCMRHMHEEVTTNHHLKHFGRLHYGLFLKGIGLTLEEQITFWRGEFTKKLDPDKWDKQHRYGIRHMYGKEGHMKELSPYSCIKIITSSVGAGDKHGCPFKHWDPRNLATKLKSIGITDAGVSEIQGFAVGGHYQIACGKVFAFTHKGAEVGINHPNQYFEESRAIITGKLGKKSLSQEASGSDSASNVAAKVGGEEMNDTALWDGELEPMDIEDSNHITGFASAWA
ncbi:unnamed protein product, partial [Darwinula stevensoni]